MINQKDLVRSYLFSHGLETNYACMEYLCYCIDTLRISMSIRQSGGRKKVKNLYTSGSDILNMWKNWLTML